MDLQQWVCNSNEVVKMHLVAPDSTNLHPGQPGFSPEFTWTFFGKEEKIWGYKGLKIDFWWKSDTLDLHLAIRWDERIGSSKPSDLVAQDVVQLIVSKLPQKGLSLDWDHWTPPFKPLGKKVHEYMSKGDTFEIYWADFQVKGFIDYHKRMQVFLQFFIDGAVDLEDDDRWECLMIFRNTPTLKGPRYEFAGFSTYYPFFHYPDKVRMRISQILILPPFQKAGHGKELYSFMYNKFSIDSQVVDITVEDPNDEFQTLRDRCDLRVLLNAGALKGITANEVKKDHLKEIMSKFRFCERQATRLIEILMLHRTSKWDAKNKRSYRLFVKKRLYKKNKDILMEMDLGDRIHALQQTYDSIEGMQYP